MNRLIICIILLSIGTAASAETLYRWIEPDGSITFSPTKPTTDVDFKAVDASADNSEATAQIFKQNVEPSILATSEHTLDPALPQANDTQILTQTAPAVVTRQGLNYAPETSVRPAAANPAVNANSAQPKNTAPSIKTVASSNKRRQCQDLSKRVLSLERRLKSPLEAEDMDNTVMAMARYQRSYDQHCIE